MQSIQQMEKLQALILLTLCCTLANLIPVFAETATNMNTNSLRLKLIHPHSSESPLLQRNLSDEERIRRSVAQSKTQSSSMRAVMEVQVFHYIVKIGIGTFKSKPPYKEYYLEMDTGSSLIWLQCSGCTKCFKQTPKPFPIQNSSSFHPLVSNNRPWLYECSYTDGASTRGVLAQERFYLGTKNGSLAKMEKIKFGCGLQNDMQYGSYRNNKIAGIMGLGWESSSLVNQLNHTFKGKFSYCLPVLSGKTSNTFLTFGDDNAADDQRLGTGPINLKKTPLYRRNQSSAYYVELQGISLNKNRLNMIKPLVFGGGCVVDSGTPYSRIVRPAFEVLKVELERYFSRSKDLKKINGDLGLELCYEFRSSGLGFGTYKLPEITFHLRDSDLVMKAEAVFELVAPPLMARRRRYICLAMVPTQNSSIIGSHQQTNHRITYDTRNQLLLF